MYFLNLRQKPFVFALAALALAMTVMGDPLGPTWWNQPHASNPADPTTLDLPAAVNGNPPNNKGPANIGQAKHIARSALLEVRAIGLAQLADDIESELVGPNKPIASWDAPADTAESEKQKSPLLLGQLKAIAAPFYQAFHAANPDWLESQLVANGTRDLTDTENYFPWSSTLNDDQNKGVATVGQLKAVFSLRFETGIELVDSDWDGLPDYRELQFGTDPNLWDTDGDGVSDGDEVLKNGTDPLLAADYEGDGICDDLEKHWARKLLAAEPDSQVWGADYAELVEGDLDPAKSYPSGGMSVGEEIAEYNKIEAFKNNFDIPDIFQTGMRKVSFSGRVTQSNTGTYEYDGTFKTRIPQNGDGTGGILEETTTSSSDFGLSALIAKCSSDQYRLPSGEDNTNSDPVVTDASKLGGWTVGVYSGYEILNSSHSGRASLMRLRIATREKINVNRDFHFLKVMCLSNYGTYAHNLNPEAILSTESVKITVPPNSHFSPWVNYEVPANLVPNGKTVFMQLLPVEVRDIDRSLTSLPLNEDPWTNANIQKQVADESIAWITGNTGAEDTPEMPKLKARIVGGPASIKVRWRFECEYRRGNGYRQAYVADFTRPEDKVGIPKRDDSDYTEELPVSQEWEIYEHPKWIQELNENGFFGGLGKVFLKLKDQPEIEVCRFRIGGRNPDEAVAKAYINSKAGSTYWYAYAVAKHETFGRVPGRFYNQFYTDHQPAGGRIGDAANDMGWAAWAKAWPLYNLDRSYSKANGYRQNGPGGYGMFQLTLGPKTPGGNQSGEAFITRSQIWNWQKSCDRAITELQGKMVSSINLENSLEANYSSWPQVDAATYGRLNGRESMVLTYYNGMFGGQLERVKVTNGRRLSCWKPVQSGAGSNIVRSWRFLQNINDYVQHVNSHIE
ncbi:MAG: hypothetical protein V4640_15745 [Verrucomicrobiota bacterium]